MDSWMEQFDNNFGLAAYVGLGHMEQFFFFAYHKIVLAILYTFKASFFWRKIFFIFFGVWCEGK
jgi:hypothetical protein